MDNIETHPFEIFIPKQATSFIIGSFPGKGQTNPAPDSDDWFYGAKRNTFWKILGEVYNVPLSTKKEKQELFTKIRMAIGDIVLKAYRREGTNSDNNLEIIELNTEAIKKVLESSNIVTLFFTSQYVAKLFRKLFPGYTNMVVLPSPSPRFAKMSFSEKVIAYKKHLPPLL